MEYSGNTDLKLNQIIGAGQFAVLTARSQLVGIQQGL